MIHPQIEGQPTTAERWAFGLLVDLSRLLPAADIASEGVRVSLVDPSPAGDFIVEPGRIRVSRGLLQRVLDIGGAAVEQRATARDIHGRVPAAENPLVRTGSERTLPLQQWAQSLVQSVEKAAGQLPVFRIGPWPGGRRWAAAVTHDLDIVSGWPLFAALRWTELLRKGDLGRMFSAMMSGVRSLGHDPVRQGIDRILEIEKSAGVRSTWFVLSGAPTLKAWRRGDVTYSLEGPAARALVARIMEGGHEIGLHGSFETRDDPELLAQERARVERVSGRAPRGVRQHFLRFDPSRTPAHAEAAGFSYDATFGFADRNAFRLGAAEVLPLWNEPGQRPLDLLEAPLTWMDRTHSKYLGQENPTEWIDDALVLARMARDAGGLWVGLWHPNVSSPLGFPGALDAFAVLVQDLMAEQPWMVSLEEIVSWRSARRRLAGRLHPGGNLELVAGATGGWSVELTELASGRNQTVDWPVHA